MIFLEGADHEFPETLRHRDIRRAVIRSMPKLGDSNFRAKGFITVKGSKDPFPFDIWGDILYPGDITMVFGDKQVFMAYRYDPKRKMWADQRDLFNRRERDLPGPMKFVEGLECDKEGNLSADNEDIEMTFSGNMFDPTSFSFRYAETEYGGKGSYWDKEASWGRYGKAEWTEETLEYYEGS